MRSEFLLAFVSITLLTACLRPKSGKTYSVDNSGGNGSNTLTLTDLDQAFEKLDLEKQSITTLGSNWKPLMKLQQDLKTFSAGHPPGSLTAEDRLTLASLQIETDNLQAELDACHYPNWNIKELLMPIARMPYSIVLPAEEEESVQIAAANEYLEKIKKIPHEIDIFLATMSKSANEGYNLENFDIITVASYIYYLGQEMPSDHELPQNLLMLMPFQDVKTSPAFKPVMEAIAEEVRGPFKQAIDKLMMFFQPLYAGATLHPIPSNPFSMKRTSGALYALARNGVATESIAYLGLFHIHKNPEIGKDCYEANLRRHLGRMIDIPELLNKVHKELVEVNEQILKFVSHDAIEIFPNLKKVEKHEDPGVYRERLLETLASTSFTDSLNYDLDAMINSALDLAQEYINPELKNLPKNYFEIKKVDSDDMLLASYVPLKANGGKPFLRINIKKMRSEMPMLPIAIWHEGIPGHHINYGFIAENKTLPFVRRMRRDVNIEGWAFYVEQLTAELGWHERLAKEYMTRLGYLKLLRLRLLRVIGDIEVNYYGKDFKFYLHFLGRFGNSDLSIALDEYNRVISEPGNVLSYYFGKHEILEARRRLKEELGDRFDLNAFHDAYQSFGNIPPQLYSEAFAHALSTKH